MKASEFKKCEHTLKVLEECGEIESCDCVTHFELIRKRGYEYFYEILMKNGSHKTITISEMNEIVCRYMFNTASKY